MTATSLNDAIMMPDRRQFGSLGFVGGIDAVGEKHAFCFQAPVAGNITDVSWFTRTTTGWNGTLRIGIQHIDEATGYPDGGWHGWAERSLLAGQTIYTETLDTPYAASANEKLALVIECMAFTAGSVNFNTLGTAGFTNRPYNYTYLGGTHSRVSAASVTFAVKLDGVWTACGGTIPSVPANLAYTSASSTDEVGNAFVMPWGCVSSGMWINSSSGSAPAGDFDAILYGASGNALQSTFVDKDQIVPGAYPSIIYWPQKQALVSGQTYRAVLKPRTSTANTIAMNRHTYDNAGHFAALPYGANIYATSRTTLDVDPFTVGAWVDCNNAGDGYRRNDMGLIIDGIDIPAGGGGGYSRGRLVNGE
jgi:hypothetical protein